MPLSPAHRTKPKHNNNSRRERTKTGDSREGGQKRSKQAWATFAWHTFRALCKVECKCFRFRQKNGMRMRVCACPCSCVGMPEFVKPWHRKGNAAFPPNHSHMANSYHFHNSSNYRVGKNKARHFRPYKYRQTPSCKMLLAATFSFSSAHSPNFSKMTRSHVLDLATLALVNLLARWLMAKTNSLFVTERHLRLAKI